MTDLPRYRYRQLGALLSSGTFQNQRIWGSCSESSWINTSSGSLYATGELQTMTDYVVPNYRQRVARGEVFFNPVRSERIVCSRNAGNGAHWRTRSGMNCSGIMRYQENRTFGNHVEQTYDLARGGTGAISGTTPNAYGLLSASDINSLVAEVCTRVNSERGRSDSNLYETLAEVDKSMGLLSDSFTRLDKVARSKTLTGRGKSAAQLWLMYRYGLMPLVRDSASIVDGMRKRLGAVRETTRSRGSLNANSTRTINYIGGQGTWHHFETVRHTVNVRAMSLDCYEASVSNNIGFTTKGLLTLPWELIGYSFVVDWFANVGDFIGAVVPAFGWSQLGSCYTVEDVKELTFSAAGCSATAGWDLVSAHSGSFSKTVRTLTRTPGLVSPSIVVKSDFRFSNFNRCADSIALLLGRFLKP